MLGLCSPVEFSFLSFSLYSSGFFFPLFYNFNFLSLLYFFYIYSLVCFPAVLFFLQLIFNIYKSLSTPVKLCSSILSFHSLLSSQQICQFYFLCVIPQFGILFQFCFSVCALVRFLLVDTIFGFLCMTGQYIIPYFCWGRLIWLMGVYAHVYIPSHFLWLL